MLAVYREVLSNPVFFPVGSSCYSCGLQFTGGCGPLTHLFDSGERVRKLDLASDAASWRAVEAATSPLRPEATWGLALDFGAFLRVDEDRAASVLRGRYDPEDFHDREHRGVEVAVVVFDCYYLNVTSSDLDTIDQLRAELERSALIDVVS